MSLVIRAAYLDICRCGEHGKIVLADGTIGPEFCSKQAAQDELKRLYGEKLVTEPEFRFLKEEISNLPRLPSTDKQINHLGLIACDFLTALRKSHDPMEQSPPNKYVM